MVWQRRGTRQWGRRNRRRYTYKKNTGSYGGVAKALALAGTALTIAHSVKKLVNVEYKSVGTTGYQQDIESGGTVQLLTAIAQGDDRNDRNGRSIKATGFNFRGVVKYNSDGVEYQQVRVNLVVDYHQDGVIPDIADIYDSADPLLFRSLNNTDRFEVLWTKYYILSAMSPVRKIEKNRNMAMKMEFIGTSAAQISMGGGTMYLVWSSDTAANHPTMDYTNRVRYIDN